VCVCVCVFHFYFKLQFQIAVSVFRVGPSTRIWRQQVPLSCWYLSTLLQLFVEHREQECRGPLEGKGGCYISLIVPECSKWSSKLALSYESFNITVICHILISSLVQNRSWLVIPCLFWDLTFYKHSFTNISYSIICYQR